jgi:hypothetical protein
MYLLRIVQLILRGIGVHVGMSGDVDQAMPSCLAHLSHILDQFEQHQAALTWT